MDQGPEREWKTFRSRSWLYYMPAARYQLTDLLPKPPGELVKTEWAGSCALHAYSESFTARMRIQFRYRNFGVDLGALIISAAGHGILRKNGARLSEVDGLAKFVGIPLEGDLPPQAPKVTRPPGYALGTRLLVFKAVPLPFNGASKEEFEAATKYREELCEHMAKGPIVVCFDMQYHFGRDTGDSGPYRHLQDPANYCTVISDSGREVRVGHCISVFAYSCPGGDVRTLKLRYQDNAEKAKDRDYIDPDAVKWYYVPDIEHLEFHTDPVSGGSQKLNPPAPPTSSSLWDVLSFLS